MKTASRRTVIDTCSTDCATRILRQAIYLYRNGRDTFFRLHGTTEPETIGSAVSSGCIRLFNQDIIDLYNRVPVGTQVTVV